MRRLRTVQAHDKDSVTVTIVVVRINQVRGSQRKRGMFQFSSSRLKCPIGSLELEAQQRSQG